MKNIFLSVRYITKRVRCVLTMFHMWISYIVLLGTNIDTCFVSVTDALRRRLLGARQRCACAGANSPSFISTKCVRAVLRTLFELIHPIGSTRNQYFCIIIKVVFG